VEIKKKKEERSELSVFKFLCVLDAKKNQVHVKCIAAVGSSESGFRVCVCVCVCVLFAGYTVVSCYVSASHLQPSSRCEIQGGCRLTLSAQPPWVPAGSRDVPTLKVARLSPPSRLIVLEEHRGVMVMSGVVLVSRQRNVDVIM